MTDCSNSQEFMIIDVDGIVVEVTRKAIKNMSLRVYPQGQVKLSVPYHLSDKLIGQFLQSKSAWLQSQQQRLKNTEIVFDEPLTTGASHWFMGRCYTLELIEQYGPSQIQRTQDRLYCYLPPNSSAVYRQAVLDRWYKKEMMQLLPELIQHWQAIVGVKALSWGVKNMKSRWGSCNTRSHHIWLNLRLIKKPIECLEYVLVHELTHLHEASHNQRFYDLMSKALPQWQEYQYMLEGRYLRKKSPSLAVNQG